jgi:hypothetical protein
MRSIEGEDSWRTLRETIWIIGIKSKEIEMTTIAGEDYFERQDRVIYETYKLPDELTRPPFNFRTLSGMGITLKFKKKWESLHKTDPDKFVSFERLLKDVARPDRGPNGVRSMIDMYDGVIKNLNPNTITETVPPAEIKSILTFSIENRTPTVKEEPLKVSAPIGWRTSVYEPNDRRTLITLTSNTLKTLQPREIVYSIPLEITSDKIPKIPNINVVFRSWEPYLLCCVGPTKDIKDIEKREQLKSMMHGYYNYVLEEKDKMRNDNTKFVLALLDGTFFLKYFPINSNKSTTEGGRRKSRRTRRKSKRSKRTRHHRK